MREQNSTMMSGLQPLSAEHKRCLNDTYIGPFSHLLCPRSALWRLLFRTIHQMQINNIGPVDVDKHNMSRPRPPLIETSNRPYPNPPSLSKRMKYMPGFPAN